MTFLDPEIIIIVIAMAVEVNNSDNKIIITTTGDNNKINKNNNRNSYPTTDLRKQKCRDYTLITTMGPNNNAQYVS